MRAGGGGTQRERERSDGPPGAGSEAPARCLRAGRTEVEADLPAEAAPRRGVGRKDRRGVEMAMSNEAAAEGFQNFGDENLQEIAAARTLLAELRAGTGERRRLAAERVETACEKRFGDLREQMLEQETAQRAEAGAARCVGAAALELLSKCAGALPLPRPPASGRETPPRRGAPATAPTAARSSPTSSSPPPSERWGTCRPPRRRARCCRACWPWPRTSCGPRAIGWPAWRSGAPLDPEEPVEPEQPVPPGPAARVASGKVASQWRRKPAN
ncbi:unnamed protein product [Prorocentrum cordatum]|uniref:Tubulin-specific chaperone A n=1 Tax=Prorocentrum cordatum TaxID=2364126 RepID=A0ABN9SZQ3_9DINO|nr:unnamed protein product [Polarella glacialis]